MFVYVCMYIYIDIYRYVLLHEGLSARGIIIFQLWGTSQCDLGNRYMNREGAKK